MSRRVSGFDPARGMDVGSLLVLASLGVLGTMLVGAGGVVLAKQGRRTR